MFLSPRALIAFNVVAFVTLKVSTAAASPNFPSAVQSQLALSSSPSCTLCHSNLSGGVGTVTQPFGVFLRSRGMVLGNLDSLKTSITADQAEKHDSDEDGIDDVTELKAGTDPNSSSTGTAIDPPNYGCGAVAAGGRRWVPSGWDASLLALVAAALFMGRRGPYRRDFSFTDE